MVYLLIIRGDNMRCNNCGVDNEEGVKYCINCGNEMNSNVGIETSNYSDNQGTNSFKEETNKSMIKNFFTRNNYEMVYITILIVCYVLGSFFDVPYTNLVSLITLITGRIKCSNSLIIKVLFWIMILYIIYMIVVILLLIIACSTGSSNNSGLY